MKTISRIFLTLATAFSLTSCYDKFVSDADESTVCFALNNPLRSVIAGRDMEIYVGVSIGGKRNVDMNDWATFQIDESLLNGTPFTLLPPSYYTISDPNTFRVRKSNLPVADVRITFTENFYNDPNIVTTYYALPFRITDSSLDVIVEDKDYTVVAFKCLSAYHGTYYVKGTLYELDAPAGSVVNTTVYSNNDLSNNITRDLSTVTLQSVKRPGVANVGVAASDAVILDVSPAPNPDGTRNVTLTAGSSTSVTGISGVYTPGEVPEFHLVYEYEKGSRYYRTDETLVLRQDPYYDLRVETW